METVTCPVCGKEEKVYYNKETGEVITENCGAVVETFESKDLEGSWAEARADLGCGFTLVRHDWGLGTPGVWGNVYKRYRK